MAHEDNRLLATISKGGAAALVAVALRCRANCRRRADWRITCPGYMKVLVALSIGLLGALLGDAKPLSAAEQNPVTAIDILLEPDATMTEKAVAANERLLKVFPKGFALGKTHAPHISTLQRYVRTADLDKINEAVGKVLAEENPAGWTLKAFKYNYVVWDKVGVTVILIEPTDQLIQFQQKLIDAVGPFTVVTGTAAAFYTTPEAPEINQPTMNYVARYVPESSGKNFVPHVTIGVAPPDYLKKMVAEPFDAFTFSPTGAAVYHLGDFGTAREKLRSWELAP